MKVVLALLIGFISLCELIYSDQPRKDLDVTERLLFPCLLRLGEDYKNAGDQKAKEKLEYQIYKHQFVYWVHVYKFGEDASELTERAFSYLNVSALDSISFLRIVKRGGLAFSGDGVFLGLTMKPTASGVRELHFDRTELDRFDELTGEFLKFMEGLRSKRLSELKEAEERLQELGE